MSASTLFYMFTVGARLMGWLVVVARGLYLARHLFIYHHHLLQGTPRFLQHRSDLLLFLILDNRDNDGDDDEVVDVPILYRLKDNKNCRN